MQGSIFSTAAIGMEQRKALARCPAPREAARPIISPLGLDPAHPFPRILNKTSQFHRVVEGQVASGRKGGMAIVQAPRSLPRIVHLPPEATGGGASDFVFLSSAIHAFVEELFPRDGKLTG